MTVPWAGFQRALSLPLRPICAICGFVPRLQCGDDHRAREAVGGERRGGVCGDDRAYDGVTVDVGAGDGRFVYRYALAHRGRFVIGIDPVAENLRELSAKAARKPERGGLANVLYAVASIEHVPAELRGIADEIFVTLPWGSLMRGIILADDTVLGRLASLARDGAALRIVLNTRIFDDPVPLDVRDLPDVTPDFVRETLAPAFARHGITITENALHGRG